MYPKISRVFIRMRNTEILKLSISKSWPPYDIVSVEEAFSWLGPRHLDTVRANTCALCLLVIYLTSCLLHTGPCKFAPHDRFSYCIDLCNALSNDLSIINPRHLTLASHNDDGYR